MKRLQLLIVIFCLAVSLPLAYVIVRTYSGLDQEERAQLRYFSETLLDEIEQELAQFVQREENRAVDEYHFSFEQGSGGIRTSPLNQLPRENYILGYLQNNPDGSFQTPLAADLANVPPDKSAIIAKVAADNAVFNQKKRSYPTRAPLQEAEANQAPAAKTKKKAASGFADRYLSKSAPKTYLGLKTVRKEAISIQQALNLAKEDEAVLRSRAPRREQAAAPAAAERPAGSNLRSDLAQSVPGSAAEAADSETPSDFLTTTAFQVEVAPLQSVYIRDGRFFVFRRIVINNQIYRQGFLLETEPFLRHLATVHFESQPMARFSSLSLHVMGNGIQKKSVVAGPPIANVEFSARRTFPAPFDFLSAALQVGAVPVSPARRALTIALAILGIIMLFGLVAIYQSARTVVDLSERRSQFVSSVTHELKTPLTNIRMYIEMLEQGIASTPEREQDYLRILGSESTRLSRLINNVLELAKLEKKQRHFTLREDRIQNVLLEVHAIMSHKLAQEGFELHLNAENMPPFAFDREVMVQVLVNLLENSIKFGRGAQTKIITITAAAADNRAHIAVSDTGPGIPRQALKKVFNDFYRVDNKLTRTTGGTGIGLALVKKFVTAMGGRVSAANNSGGGCTISLFLPLKPPESR